MRRARRLGLLLGAVAIAAARLASAQSLALMPQPVALRVPSAQLTVQAAVLFAPRLPDLASDVRNHPHTRKAGIPAPDTARRAAWWAPAASALLPGAGQLLLRQQRSVAYAVAESYLMVQAFSAQRDGNRERQRYRDLASDVARKPLSAVRPVGDWDYYESLEKFTDSGMYDRIPGGAVDPETDPTTYNGRRWLLARETFWRDPDAAPPIGSVEYTRALNFYLQYAVTDEFRWSWRDAQLQQNVYVQTIASANRSYQRANNLVGLIGANHLASLIDAYISVRIRRFGGAGVGGVRLDGVSTNVMSVGDPADGRRLIRTQLRLIAR